MIFRLQAFAVYVHGNILICLFKLKPFVYPSLITGKLTPVRIRSPIFTISFVTGDTEQLLLRAVSSNAEME